MHLSTQAPLPLQTLLPFAHDEPADFCMPSWHTAGDQSLLQVTVPLMQFCWFELVVQVPLATQRVTQPPLVLQTLPPAQSDPAAFFVVSSTQFGEEIGLAQAQTPLTQLPEFGLLVQAPPATQAGWQVPPLHARPALQAFPAQQGCPLLPQLLQLPLLQTIALPHPVPSG